MGSVTSNPKINVSLLPAAVVDAYEDRRDIIFGQTGAAGNAVSQALNTNTQALTTAQIKTLFGATSYLTNCILSWKATNEGNSPLDVIGIDAGAGNAATGTITFAGTSTSAGTYYISVVDEEAYQVEVAIPSGTAAIAAATLVVTAIGTLTDPVFTAANGGGALAVVTFTATDAGTFGNDYGIKVEGSVPGLTATIASFVTTATGTGTPTLTSILDNIAGIRYTGVLWPEDWATTLIEAEMETRFNASNAILDGTVFHGLTATYATSVAAPALNNSQTIVLMGSPVLNLATHKGPAVLRPADWVAAEFQGIRARRLTPGASIADYIITTSGGLDAFGGPSLASLPYFNTPLNNTPVTASTNMFSATEQLALETAGFTTYGPNSAQNAMITGPVVTCYTTDDGGNTNPSFHYLNYIDTGSVCREIIYRTLKSTFAQSRLTEGDLIPERSMANAESIKAELLRIYKTLSNLALTQAGREAEGYFATNTTVSVSLATRTATITGPLPIVTQLGTVNYSLQLSFTIEGTGTQITV